MTGPAVTAEDLARELLARLPERVAHTEGVARKAEEAAAVFEPDEAADLVAAAWLHDIGYAQWLVGEGMHALDGGWFLQERKFQTVSVSLWRTTRVPGSKRASVDSLTG